MPYEITVAEHRNMRYKLERRTAKDEEEKQQIVAELDLLYPPEDYSIDVKQVTLDDLEADALNQTERVRRVSGHGINE